MPLDKETQKRIIGYASNHLRDLNWHIKYFDFVRDPKLRSRLGREFWAARFVYKSLEGLSAKDALLRTQIKIQILQYASIHEAVIHYLVFSVYRFHPESKSLSASVRRTKVSVSNELMNKLSTQCNIPLEEIVVTRVRPDCADLAKIRFDHKVEAAAKIGLIKPKLKKDLITIYAARNAIHIHAEIRKDIDYELGLSKMAYLRLKPLREQVLRKLIIDEKRHPSYLNFQGNINLLPNEL